jgi:hypothetical protein
MASRGRPPGEPPARPEEPRAAREGRQARLVEPQAALVGQVDRAGEPRPAARAGRRAVEPRLGRAGRRRAQAGWRLAEPWAVESRRPRVGPQLGLVERRSLSADPRAPVARTQERRPLPAVQWVGVETPQRVVRRRKSSVGTLGVRRHRRVGPRQRPSHRPRPAAARAALARRSTAGMARPGRPSARWRYWLLRPCGVASVLRSSPLALARAVRRRMAPGRPGSLWLTKQD